MLVRFGRDHAIRGKARALLAALLLGTTMSASPLAAELSCPRPAVFNFPLSESYRDDRIEIHAERRNCASVVLRVFDPDGKPLLEEELYSDRGHQGRTTAQAGLAELLLRERPWPLRATRSLPPLEHLAHPGFEVLWPDEYRAAVDDDDAALLCARTEAYQASCFWFDADAGEMHRVLDLPIVRDTDSGAFRPVAPGGGPIGLSGVGYREASAQAKRIPGLADVGEADRQLAGVIARLKRARGEVGDYKHAIDALLSWATHAQAIREALVPAARDRAMAAALSAVAARADDRDVGDSYIDETGGLRLLAWAVKHASSEADAGDWSVDALALRDVLPAITFGDFDEFAMQAALAAGRYGDGAAARRLRAVLRDVWQTAYNRLSPVGLTGEEAPGDYVRALFSDYLPDWSGDHSPRTLYVTRATDSGSEPELTFTTINEAVAAINEAVAAARDGDEIHLAGGHYRESVMIDKPLRLTGHDAVVIGTGEAPALVIDAEGAVRFFQVPISFAAGANEAVGIQCRRVGVLAIGHLRLSAEEGVLVDAGSCALEVFGATFAGGDTAIRARDSRGGHLQGNLFLDQADHAIDARDSELDLRLNTFAGRSRGGVLLDGGPDARLRHNRFDGQRLGALTVKAVEHVLAAHNDFAGGTDGIWFSGRHLVLADNRFDIERAALVSRLRGAMSVRSRRNGFHGGRVGIGVFAEGDAAVPTVTMSGDAYRGVEHAIELMGVQSASIDGVAIGGDVQLAMLAEQALITLRDSEIAARGEQAIVVRGGELSVERSRFDAPANERISREDGAVVRLDDATESFGIVVQ